MRILLIDDDQAVRQVTGYNLRKSGLDVDEAADGAQGLDLFDPAAHDIVLTDLRMPHKDGMAVLAGVHARSPTTPVLVITAHGGVESAVHAMRAGAWDYLEKPFSRDALQLTLRRALELVRLRKDNARLRSDSVERPIVAASAEMTRVLEMVDRLAKATAPALIVGQSGTGKELLARRLHARSSRSSGPFVAVNCAAIPADLLESEMFGHARGAFSGASRARLGRFRKADGGTLFLDEIGELPLNLQAKLLRVLQEGELSTVGSDETTHVDVRIVTATNQDLDEAVRDGSFREDLFYRLDVVRITVPPLAARPDDIAPLAAAFVAELSGGRDLDLPDAVVDELRARPWPGNVRQLRNAISRLVVLCPTHVLRVEDLPPTRHGPTTMANWLDHVPAELSLVDLERQLVERALTQHDWNLTHAARALGVPRHVMAYRVQKFGLQRDDG